MGFVTDIALAYIAFGVGRYFKIATLKKRRGTLIITVLEALLAMAAITLPMIFLFHLPVPFSRCWAPSAAPRRLLPPL